VMERESDWLRRYFGREHYLVTALEGLAMERKSGTKS
jgi:hypothetical protein